MIEEEIVRLEKLQRLAEKIHQEAKMTDGKLDDIEAWIEDEAKRIDHLHPKDAKNNCEQIERELTRTEETIKSMFSDVQILRDNRFSQSQDLHRRYYTHKHGFSLSPNPSNATHLGQSNFFLPRLNTLIFSMSKQ